MRVEAMGIPQQEDCNKCQRLSLELDQESAGRADPPNSVSTVSFINVHHSSGGTIPFSLHGSFIILDLISQAVLLDGEPL